MTKAEGKSLAIRYAAYLEARHTGDDAGVIVWGPMLADIQQRTGVELTPRHLIDAMVSAALEREKATRKQEAA